MKNDSYKASNFEASPVFENIIEASVDPIDLIIVDDGKKEAENHEKDS